MFFLNFIEASNEKEARKQWVCPSAKRLKKVLYSLLLSDPIYFSILVCFERLKTYGCANLNSIIPLSSIEAIELCPRTLSFLRARVFRHRPTTLMLWILGEHTGLGECTITPIQTVCSCYVLPAVWHYGIFKKLWWLLEFFMFFWGCEVWVAFTSNCALRDCGVIDIETWSRS